jgi:gamma-glutamyltranspeptidase / glutathione hydrolase / leukotriene-C4 hydrolase
MKLFRSFVPSSGMGHERTVLPRHTEKRPSTTEPQRRRRHFWDLSLVLFLLILTVSSGRIRQFIFRLLSTGAEGAKFSDRKNPAYLIKAEHGAVASENELCSTMGVDILKEGGNAVDSAVGTTFCIGVVNMFS